MEQCGMALRFSHALVGLAQQVGRLIRGGPRAPLLLLAGATLLCQCGAPAGGAHQEVIREGQFGQLRLFEPPARPAHHLVLLLSGDGGWGPGLDAIAQRLASGGTAVAGIDVRTWRAALEQAASTCVSPGASLAQLGRSLQARFALHEPPVLIGHSAGATLAYVALAQGRAPDFRGAVTLSFCVDLDLAKPLCAAPALRSTPRSGGVRLAPGGALPAPWVGLHGLDDRECPAAEGRSFMQAVPGARFVPLPGQGHTYDDIDSWWAWFSAAYRALTPAQVPGSPRL
jgi:type IV secretory pathway VirJ component